MARRKLFEQTLANEMSKDSGERFRVGASGRCELIDLRNAGIYILGDPQSDHYVNTPRSAKVAQRPKIHGRISLALSGCRGR